MKSYEFQAKTVEKAIEKGLNELGKSKLDVDIKILENGGLFKKAKVLICFEEESTSLKDLMTDDIVEEETILSQETQNHDDEVATLPLTEENRLTETEGLVEVVEPIQETITESETQSEQDVETPTEQIAETTLPQEKQKKQRIYANNKGSKKFIEGLLASINIEAVVNIEEQEEHTKAIIQTQQAGLVIGHRGEGLSAIQYLANIVEQKQNKYAKRLICDVADYRERRDDSLKDLADRMARQVLKLRKSIKLKPMNAYDRRIVHTYLQNFKGVNTHSVGKEPNRCLIIDINRD